MKTKKTATLLLYIIWWLPLLACAQDNRLLIVELNCENLFDTEHDSLKNDLDFTPDGSYHWTRHRYWQKVNRTAQTILSCGADSAETALPDLIGLCEVENDSVMVALTRRSLLRKARYEYVMAASPDQRGIDVALIYQPFSFRLLHSTSFRVPPIRGMKPTRDILYATGQVISGDTLHVFVVHAPSRSGGEAASRPFRKHVANFLATELDSIRNATPDARFIIMGDFNDNASEASLQLLRQHGLTDASSNAQGRNGAKGTYRYHGAWGSLDHILVSENMSKDIVECHINDAEFLLEEDKKYGGVKPRRNYTGPRYNNGFSDHLPLVLTLSLGASF